MANGFQPLSIIPKQTTASPDFMGILKLLSQARPGFTEAAVPQIAPLLRPTQGISPELQNVIKNIQSLGQENISRNLAGLTTQFQRRGLTGSTIEGGALAKAQTEGAKGIESTILQLLLQGAQEQTQQRNVLAQFLERAFGIDISGRENILQSLASELGGEAGRRNQLNLLNRQISGAKSLQPSFLEQILPSLISTGAGVGLGAGLGSLAGIGAGQGG